MHPTEDSLSRPFATRPPSYSPVTGSTMSSRSLTPVAADFDATSCASSDVRTSPKDVRSNVARTSSRSRTVSGGWTPGVGGKRQLLYGRRRRKGVRRTAEGSIAWRAARARSALKIPSVSTQRTRADSAASKWRTARWRARSYVARGRSGLEPRSSSLVVEGTYRLARPLGP